VQPILLLEVATLRQHALPITRLLEEAEVAEVAEAAVAEEGEVLEDEAAVVDVDADAQSPLAA
jgi:hypothetical protein